MNERRYSLRTCAIIVAIGIVLSWAPIIGLWLWLKPAGGFNPDLPPKQYQGDARAQVHFTRHAKTLCAIMKAEPGSIACAGVGATWMIVPNPCDWKSDPFARLMCHEKGHNLGHAADHPRS